MEIHVRRRRNIIWTDLLRRSRCLAVTAYQDVFRMFALYGAEELERQVQAGMPLNPIKEVQHKPIAGLGRCSSGIRRKLSVYPE